MSLKLVVTREAPLATVVALGRIDADSARVVRLKAQSLLATGHPLVVLDLSLADMADVDDACVAVLAYARRIYRIAGGSLSMVGAGAELEARLARTESEELLATATLSRAV